MMVCYFEITGICRSEKYLEKYIFTKQRFEKKFDMRYYVSVHLMI